MSCFSTGFWALSLAPISSLCAAVVAPGPSRFPGPRRCCVLPFSEENPTLSYRSFLCLVILASTDLGTLTLFCGLQPSTVTGYLPGLSHGACVRVTPVSALTCPVC